MIVLTILAALFLPYLIIYLYKNAYNRPKNFPPGELHSFFKIIKNNKCFFLIIIEKMFNFQILFCAHNSKFKIVCGRYLLLTFFTTGFNQTDTV